MYKELLHNGMIFFPPTKNPGNKSWNPMKKMKKIPKISKPRLFPLPKFGNFPNVIKNWYITTTCSFPQPKKTLKKQMKSGKNHAGNFSRQLQKSNIFLNVLKNCYIMVCFFPPAKNPRKKHKMPENYKKICEKSGN